MSVKVLSLVLEDNLVRFSMQLKQDQTKGLVQEKEDEPFIISTFSFTFFVLFLMWSFILFLPSCF